MGLMHSRKGEGHWMNKLKDKDVRRIKRLLFEGGKPKPIAKEYNVTMATIYHILNGSTWSHIH